MNIELYIYTVAGYKWVRYLDTDKGILATARKDAVKCESIHNTPSHYKLIVEKLLQDRPELFI